LVGRARKALPLWERTVTDTSNRGGAVSWTPPPPILGRAGSRDVAWLPARSISCGEPMKLRPVVAGLALSGFLALSAACASSGQGSRGDINVLTAAEMADAPVSNLYEAVEKLRPRWLQIRTRRSINMESEVSVFMNRLYLGGPEELRSIGLNGVAQLRYLDGALASATLRVPTGRAIEGAIVVEMSGGG